MSFAEAPIQSWKSASRNGVEKGQIEFGGGDKTQRYLRLEPVSLRLYYYLGRQLCHEQRQREYCSPFLEGLRPEQLHSAGKALLDEGL